MALRVRRIKKAFGFDKSKTEKYVIVPDRATVVGFEALCDQVAAVSGINLGMVQSVVYGLVKSMTTFIRQGHSVQVTGFGTFVPSFNAKSSLGECGFYPPRETTFPSQRGVAYDDEIDGIRIRCNGQYERFQNNLRRGR